MRYATTNGSSRVRSAHPLVTRATRAVGATQRGAWTERVQLAVLHQILDPKVFDHDAGRVMFDQLSRQPMPIAMHLFLDTLPRLRQQPLFLSTTVRPLDGPSETALGSLACSQVTVVPRKLDTVRQGDLSLDSDITSQRRSFVNPVGGQRVHKQLDLDTSRPDHDSRLLDIGEEGPLEADFADAFNERSTLGVDGPASELAWGYQTSG